MDVIFAKGGKGYGFLSFFQSSKFISTLAELTFFVLFMYFYMVSVWEKKGTIQVND